MNRTRLLVIGCVLIVAVAGAAQFLAPRRAAAPQPVVTESPSVGTPSATTSDPTTIIVQIQNPDQPKISDLPPIATGDTIISWDFRSAYSNNPDLVTKARTEIDRLSGLVGVGEDDFPDMVLYVGIANQYDLLGEGKQEYEYLSRAIESADGRSGLPWHNLGVLMERIGALETARVAYENSTLIQPEFKFYHYAYFEFLTTRMKNNVTAIEKEFTVAIQNLGQDTDILQLYAEWKKV